MSLPTRVDVNIPLYFEAKMHGMLYRSNMVCDAAFHGLLLRYELLNMQIWSCALSVDV